MDYAIPKAHDGPDDRNDPGRGAVGARCLRFEGRRRTAGDSRSGDDRQRHPRRGRRAGHGPADAARAHRRGDLEQRRQRPPFRREAHRLDRLEQATPMVLDGRLRRDEMVRAHGVDARGHAALVGRLGRLVRVRHASGGVAASARPRARRDRRFRRGPDAVRPQPGDRAGAARRPGRGLRGARCRGPSRRERPAGQTELVLHPRPDADDAGRRDHHPAGLDRPRRRRAVRRRGARPARRADPDDGARNGHLRGRRRLLGRPRPLLSGRGAAHQRGGRGSGRADAARDRRREVVRVGLPYGAMHLDGLLNFLDRDLAVVWPRRTPLQDRADAQEARLPVHRGRGRGRGPALPADELRRARARAKS